MNWEVNQETDVYNYNYDQLEKEENFILQLEIWTQSKYEMIYQ